MSEDRFFTLFTRKLSGDASSEELEALAEILCQHPELRFFYDELIKPASQDEKDLEVAEQSFTSDVMQMQLSGVWDQAAPAPDASKKVGFRRRWYQVAAAAAFILFVGIAVILLQEKGTRLHSSNETTTPKGSKSTVKLPDGTVVMLNANSSLKYDERFKTDQREVILHGEAYFDVAHDATRPFIIHTETADIKVLGTAFNVRSFGNGYFETALIRGKVSIHLKHQAEGTFVLSPGQKIVVQDNKAHLADKTNQSSSVKIDSITVMDGLVAETSWTQGQLVFADKPLVEIAATLEQIFDVKIIFRSDKSKYTRYNGSFSETDLDEILEIINMSKPIKYHREKDTIFIE